MAGIWGFTGTECFDIPGALSGSRRHHHPSPPSHRSRGVSCMGGGFEPSWPGTLTPSTEGKRRFLRLSHSKTVSLGEGLESLVT